MTASSRHYVRLTAVAASAAVWLSGSAAVAQPAQAASPIETLTLEEAMSAEIPRVVGASRFVQEVLDAPANVTVVTREDIERFGYVTFDQVLRSVRGFYTSYDRNYAYVGVRGFARPGDYNSRVLLLVNGHRLNDNIYDAAPIGTDFPIDVDLVDRVEIVRGPASSLYGTSAFLAVINVVTRSGAGVGSGTAVRVGSLGTRALRGTVGRSFANGSDVLLSATGYASAGENRVSVGDAASVGMDDDDSWSLFGSATKGNWRAEGAYVNRRKGIPTGAFETALDDPRSETSDRIGYFDVAYQGPVKGAALLWRASYDRYFYDGTYGNGAGVPLSGDGSQGEWYSTETTMTRRAGRHLVTAGGELRLNARQDQAGWDASEPTEFYIDDRRSSATWGVYAQDELKITPKWIVNGGLRYDNLATFGGTVNPRVGLIYKPIPAGSFKLLTGTAFRAPNVYELYSYGDASDWLRPERIWTTEAVWEQFLTSATRVSASVFESRIDDLITQREDPDGLHGIGFFNVSGADARGIEAEVERTWRHGVETLGTYTFTSALGRENGARLSNSPRHLGGVRVLLPLFSRGTVGVETRFTSARLTLAGEEAPRFWITNVNVVQRRLLRDLTLVFDVDNVFDRKYEDPVAEEHITGTIVQDGRTARVKIAWGF
jgi:iron complex outermembrane receptor protein